MTRMLHGAALAALFATLAMADGPGPSSFDPPPWTQHPHPNGGEWIGRGMHRNAAGELCCGERDCFEISSDGIAITSSGYFIKGLRETVPYDEAQPSPDGAYWRCQWGGKRKCFFAPPPNT